MKIADAHIAWTPTWQIGDDPSPTAGTVKVGTLQSNWASRWDQPHLFSSGACESRWAEAGRAAQERFLAILFITMTVRDGLDPRVVHRALLQIDEYRQRMVSPDTYGATDEDDQPFSRNNDWQMSLEH